MEVIVNQMPYEEYIAQVVRRLHPWQNIHQSGKDVVFEEPWVSSMSVRELKGLLTDAWLEGLGHSLVVLMRRKIWK
jgi:hypothetical protein